MRALNINQVIELTSLSKATIYRKVQDGSFPKQHVMSIGKTGRLGRVAWLDAQVKNWIAESFGV